MTTYRNRTPDAEAAQYLPTPDQLDTFSDRPAWLETAIEVGEVKFRTRDDDGVPYVSLSAKTGHVFVPAGDWIVRDRWGHIFAMTAELFPVAFDLFEPATPAEPTADAATGLQETAATGGAAA